MKIPWVPDAIPLSGNQLYEHFKMKKSNISELETHPEYYRIYGYSCRCLFEVLLQVLESKKYQYAISPIHHTSWKNIIQKYIPENKISVIHLSENFQDLEKLDFSQIKVIIISHLFGQDFDFQLLSQEKEKHNFIVIEDRVQGGSLNQKFSHDCVDFSFYSCGMDKRPVALGGGFLYARINQKEILRQMWIKLELLPREKELDRAQDLIFKIPTYLIYNFSIIFQMVAYFLKLIFQKNLSQLIQKYREKNPGFTHDKYLKRPSYSLLGMLHLEKNNFRTMEKKFLYKYEYFHHQINRKYIPWRKGSCYSMYNAVLIPLDELDSKIKHWTKIELPYLKNPTWKVLDCVKDIYQEKLDRIFYLPCIYHQSFQELHDLAQIVNS